MEQNFERCMFCDSEHPAEEFLYMDGNPVCRECFDEHTVECENCGARVWRDHAFSDGHITICRLCRTNYYSTCNSCGAFISEGEACYYDGDDYCSSCYDEICDDSIIHCYDYKPWPIFYPKFDKRNIYLGVELEIDEAGEDIDNARDLLDIANDERENMYVKHDGSLNEGLELVSHPMTLEEHTNNLPWSDICRKAIQLGYLSHQAGTCGLHVHVSRSAFGNLEEQEAVIGRILYFMEAHWNELLKFSRRTQSQLDRWASRYGYKDTPKEVLDHAKQSGIGRYACVNLRNADTIEFRIFRGTLKYSSFIAALQLVDRICRVAIALSDEEFKAMTWSSFVSGITHTELIEYLKSRRLYVNEILETEGAI